MRSVRYRSSLRRAAALAAVCMAWSATVLAQSGADDVVSLKARLVNIDVVVRDKKGKVIPDLTPADFVVEENGVAQTVEFVDPPLIASSIGSGAPANGGDSPRELRNIISLLLDAQTTETIELKRIADGTERYVRERIGASDSVAVFRVAHGLQMLQPFTRDKTQVIAAVARGFTPNAASTVGEARDVSTGVSSAQDTLASLGSAAGSTSVPGAKSQADAAAQVEAVVASRTLEQFTRLRSQLAVEQSRPVIAAMAAICEAQRGISGKKVLVVFSQGFVTASTQDWQVQRLVDLANRANVSIFIIDSSGLSADAPRGGGPVPTGPLQSVSGAVSQESRIRAVGGEDVFDNIRHEGINRQQEVLYRISGDTGGAFFKNMNDVGRGLQRIDDELRSRYTIGYTTTDPDFDGSFRKIKISVRRPDAQIEARPGYYAISNDDVPLSPDEQKLLSRFDSLVSSSAFQIFSELAAFRSADGRYVIPLAMEIPPSALQVQKDHGDRLMRLEVLGIVKKDDAPKVLSRMGGSFDVRLDDEQFKAVEQNNIFFRQDIELEPGTYGFEIVVRDKLSGKIAARREQIVLPSDETGLAMSGVVLSRLALPADAATASGDILSAGGAHVRPSPSRAFRASDRLIVFFEAYGAREVNGRANAKVTVTISRDGQPVMRPLAYALTDVVADPVPHLPFAKFVALRGLAPGAYTVTIETRDALSGAVVTRREPFEIVE